MVKGPQARDSGGETVEPLESVFSPGKWDNDGTAFARQLRRLNETVPVTASGTSLVHSRCFISLFTA